MREGYNFKILKENILTLSEAKDWEVARKEWCLIDIEESEDAKSCLCGHFPIVEICTIRNTVTNKITEVGNVCVKRFLGIRSDLIFSALKRIRKDIEKSLNPDALAFFRERGVLSRKEYEFLEDIRLKRDLFARQISWRCSLNRKVLAFVVKRGLSDVKQGVENL